MTHSTSGFFAKAVFLERMSKQPKQSDLFLIYSLLSVTARFTPSLRGRYEGGRKATELFTERATDWSLKALHQPTVEHTQAFFLLGLAEWGSNDRNLSCVGSCLFAIYLVPDEADMMNQMHMGIAVRSTRQLLPVLSIDQGPITSPFEVHPRDKTNSAFMTVASILGLHREQTYNLSSNPTATEILDLEVARRTFWVLQGNSHPCCRHYRQSKRMQLLTLRRCNAVGQESLHCDTTVPAAFPLRDVTVLLPCEETDFASGRQVMTRAALPGTLPALRNPNLVGIPQRSLFAALI